jgi:hypothetical protein
MAEPSRRSAADNVSDALGVVEVATDPLAFDVFNVVVEHVLEPAASLAADAAGAVAGAAGAVAGIVTDLF